MDKTEEIRLRDKIEWYQDKVLSPLNAMVENRYFQFPLPREYFGSRKLGVRFYGTTILSKCFYLGLHGDDVIYLSYDMAVYLPFTITPIADPFDAIVCDDTRIGIGHAGNIRDILANFSVFSVLRGYFPEAVILPSDLREGMEASRVVMSGGKPWRKMSVHVTCMYTSKHSIFQ